MKLIKTLMGLVVAAGILSVAVAVVEAEEAWQISLKQQLLKERSCELKYMTKLREFRLAGKDVVEGRAHCTDGMEYDFVWREELQKFDIKRCEPVVC